MSNYRKEQDHNTKVSPKKLSGAKLKVGIVVGFITALLVSANAYAWVCYGDYYWARDWYGVWYHQHMGWWHY